MKKLLMLALACAVLSGTACAAAGKGKVLVVMSGVDYLTLKEGKQHKTGYFLVELTGPALALQKAGYELVFANPTGKEPAMDQSSDNARWFKTQKEYEEAKAFSANSAGLKQPRRLDSITKRDAGQFKALFVPGGHAPMEDLARDKNMGRLLRFFHAMKKPTALICHGPAALLSSTGGGKWIYDGYKMTVFSTEEEKISENGGGLEGHVRFYPGDELSKAGGLVEAAAPWTSRAVRDRELITGQNPMSEAEFTALLLEALDNEKVTP
ncbi:MAG: type 1 glutamine amidotransferase domain-containing protein [Elusimicrobiales bacterium]|nr:type 1 glutamine amidotransferase domain-containing protein [Elusimicrobiales bacterium]